MAVEADLALPNPPLRRTWSSLTRGPMPLIVSLRRRGIGKKSDAPPRRRKDTIKFVHEPSLSV
jgi:hypothetical protein